MKNYFVCENCGKKVFLNKQIGTHHRNHCPHCLWSKHVDENCSGDRKSRCHGKMEPIGLSFKKECFDKYGRKKQGEIMLVHKCLKCKKISINRLAGDDEPAEILKILRKSSSPQDEKEVLTQLFGK